MPWPWTTETMPRSPQQYTSWAVAWAAVCAARCRLLIARPSIQPLRAGKSTVAEDLSKSPFWQKYGSRIVVIAADGMCASQGPPTPLPGPSPSSLSFLKPCRLTLTSGGHCAAEIKMQDPVYQALDQTGVAASTVHSYSVQQAEELFLAAVRKRKGTRLTNSGLGTHGMDVRSPADSWPSCRHCLRRNTDVGAVCAADGCHGPRQPARVPQGSGLSAQR